MNKSWLALAIAAGLLAGCNSNNDNSVTPSAPQAVLSGTAVKGVLSNASVVACLATSVECRTATFADFDNAPATGQLGSVATTQADGSYSLTLPESAHDRAVLVRMFATSQTTEVCDYTGCTGAAGELEGLELSTVTLVEEPTSNNQTTSAPVTALSTMAAQTFIDTVSLPTGAVDPTTFSQAQRVVSKAVTQALGLSADAQSLNLFETALPSATATDLGSNTSSVLTELSLVNASFGTVVQTGTDSLSQFADNVSTVVQSSQSGSSVDADAALTALANDMASLNTEIQSNVTELTTGDNAIDIPTETVPTLPEDKDDIKNGIDEVVIPDVEDKEPDNGGTGGTGGTGGSGGSGGSSGGTGN